MLVNVLPEHQEKMSKSSLDCETPFWAPLWGSHSGSTHQAPRQAARRSTTVPSPTSPDLAPPTCSTCKGTATLLNPPPERKGCSESSHVAPACLSSREGQVLILARLPASAPGLAL